MSAQNKEQSEKMLSPTTKPGEGHWSEDTQLEAEPLVMTSTIPLPATNIVPPAVSQPIASSVTSTPTTVSPEQSLEIPPADAAVAIVGPPAVGKTYFCKGLAKLFLHPERLQLPVKNLTAHVKRRLPGQETQAFLPREYLALLEKGVRENPTAPALGVNLHELTIRWGERDAKGRAHQHGSVSILLNDTAGEHLRGNTNYQELSTYLANAAHFWLLIPSWVLGQSEDVVLNGQLRSPQKAIEAFAREVAWLDELLQATPKGRRIHLIWTMSSDPCTQGWLRQHKLLEAWQQSSSLVTAKSALGFARLVSFQRTMQDFLEDYLETERSLVYLKHSLSQLRQLGPVRHSMVNVIDDLQLDEEGQHKKDVRDNLMHIEAPLLSFLSTQMRFGQ